MSACVAAILVATLALPPAAVEHGGVRVAVTIKSHQYEWAITNVDAPPITRFEAEVHNCYAEVGPAGWEIEIADGHLAAWTDDAAAAIRPGQSRAVQAQVSSAGAVLGIVPVRVGTDGGGTIELEAWGPIGMPLSVILASAATITACAGLHAGVIAMRRRSARA